MSKKERFEIFKIDRIQNQSISRDRQSSEFYKAYIKLDDISINYSFQRYNIFSLISMTGGTLSAVFAFFLAVTA